METIRSNRGGHLFDRGTYDCTSVVDLWECCNCNCYSSIHNDGHTHWPRWCFLCRTGLYLSTKVPMQIPWYYITLSFPPSQRHWEKNYLGGCVGSASPACDISASAQPPTMSSISIFVSGASWVQIRMGRSNILHRRRWRGSFDVFLGRILGIGQVS